MSDSHRTPPAFAAAWPDAANAVAFVLAWTVPLHVGMPFVRSMLATYALELLAIQATGLLVAQAQVHENARTARSSVIVLGVGYVVAAAVSCAVLFTFWPLVTFALLVLAKVRPLLARAPGAPWPGLDIASWIATGAAWILVTIATAIVPLPQLGFDAAAVEALALPWPEILRDRPQWFLAAGTLYFAIVATLRGVRAARAERPRKGIRT